MRVRDQMLVIEAFEKVTADLPFAMLGIDSDNDSTFMSQAVFDYCKGRGLKQTRSRPYKKNDQAWVEQKNGAIVRRLVGYGRLSGREATKALAQLYESSRLYINFFQPHSNSNPRRATALVCTRFTSRRRPHVNGWLPRTASSRRSRRS